jgi:hypothetical protein
MGYHLSREQFDQFLDRLQVSYRVFGPAVDSDRGNFADTDRITYKEVRRGGMHRLWFLHGNLSRGLPDEGGRRKGRGH